MRSLISLVLLAAVGTCVSAVSAQVTDSAEPNVHSVIGVVSQVANDSMKLKANNGERELLVDKSTTVVAIGRTNKNDLVYRPSRARFSYFVRVGDEALVTYRDKDGVLTALTIRIPPPGRRTNR